MCGYIFGNYACIGTSLDSYFFLSHFVWMCLPVSGYTITYCGCIYVRLLIRVSLSVFLWRILLLFSYNFCDWFYVYRYISLSPHVLSLTFSLFVSASGYIIGNLHVYRSAHSMCNCAIDFFSLFMLRVYVRLLIRIAFPSSCLNVCSSLRIYYH